MKSPIYPLLKEGYISSHLKREEKSRRIILVPQSDGYLPFYVGAWLNFKLNIKKLLNKLWKK